MTWYTSTGEAVQAPRPLTYFSRYNDRKAEIFRLLAERGMTCPMCGVTMTTGPGSNGPQAASLPAPGVLICNRCVTVRQKELDGIGKKKAEWKRG